MQQFADALIACGFSCSGGGGMINEHVLAQVEK
jgi:hypothetical protein